MVDDQSYFDFVIVGGGLVGASLAIALQDTNKKIAVIERQVFNDIQFSDISARCIALSYASKKIFSQLNIWSSLKDIYPIKHIHISDRGHFGLTRIHAEEQGVDALGFSIQAQYLAKTLYDNMNSNITWIRPAKLSSLDLENKELCCDLEGKKILIRAGLIVVADGANSTVCELLGIKQVSKDYNQSAVLANVSIEKDHQGTAFERFTEVGPIALLPIAEKKMALVWTMTHAQALVMKDEKEEIFLEKLQAAFGRRLGKFLSLTRRSSYPLNSSISQEQSRPGLIILGNAAHALHPVAAQGFNLALRDVMALADLLKTEKTEKEIIEQYQTERSYDQKQTIGFTNDLLAIFSHRVWPITPLRGIGLTVLDNVPFLKKIIAKRAMGFRQPVIANEYKKI